MVFQELAVSETDIHQGMTGQGRRQWLPLAVRLETEPVRGGFLFETTNRQVWHGDQSRNGSQNPILEAMYSRLQSSTKWDSIMC